MSYRVVPVLAALCGLCTWGFISAQQPARSPIIFEVRLPAGAQLWIDGHKTTSTGETRRFETPPLPAGKPYQYTLKSTHDGKEATQTITVRHGPVASFDLRAKFVAKVPTPPPPPPGGTPGTGAGVVKLETPKGTLARRASGSEDWTFPAEGTALPEGDLCVGLPNAAVDSANGNVRLHLRANFDEHAPLPTVEAAVVLRKTTAFDLEFTLDRGRIVLVNQRAEGESKVRVHFRDRYWDLTLKDPETVVGMELFSRWLPGQRFRPDAKEPEEPPTTVVLLVLKGRVDRQCPVCLNALMAPPGPAVMQWDSVGGQDEKPIDLEKVPDWAQPKELEAERTARIAKFHEMLMSKPLREVLLEMLASDDPAFRRGGAYVSGGLDQLDLLADALHEGKHPDLWQHAVVAVRHWLGRAAGNDQKLYEGMIARKKLTKAEAATLVQLLHTFSDEQLRQPETYELLIEYLKHDKLPIRGLANWHLRRLVPAGRDIPYDPAGSAESHAKAHEAWEKLIPDGKLPPAPAGGADPG